METKERIKWLDGLKGLACLLVFVHHFLLSFFSAAYFGVESHTRLHGYDTYLASAPIGVFANGNFQVCIFLLIAAFLPAKRIMECRKEDLQDVAGRMLLKRYPRLMIPVFSVCALNYVILFLVNRLGLNYMGTELSYHGYSYFLHSGHCAGGSRKEGKVVFAAGLSCDRARAGSSEHAIYALRSGRNAGGPHCK